MVVAGCPQQQSFEFSGEAGCSCKRKCFGSVTLHVLKLMSLILVKLNCPVRDD